MLDSRFTRVSRGAVAGLLCACVLVACTLSPALPTNAVAFQPPSVYARWWSMTEQCSGASRPITDVSWFRVPDVSVLDAGGQEARGYWDARARRIVLAGTKVLDGGSVRHEMLHALLGAPGHPRSQFLGRCAGIVNCDGPCVTEGDRLILPVSPVVVLSADPLDVAVAIDPRAPGSSSDSGAFTILVTARNQSDHWVVIANTNRSGGPMHTFGFELRGTTGGFIGGRIANDTSRVLFAPRETKRQAFDLSMGGDLAEGHPPAGAYEVRGGYGSHWSPYASIVLGP